MFFFYLWGLVDIYKYQRIFHVGGNKTVKTELEIPQISHSLQDALGED
jgi:hypothetical protein